MPYPCTDDPNEILEYVSAAKSNAQKFNTFVNGSSAQTVQLGTGDPTPTIRKFIADAQSVVATAANDAAETALDVVADMKLNKADKFVPAEPGNLAKLSSYGNLRDAGRAAEDFVPLLNYANDEAIELAWQNRMAVKHYREWVDEQADRHKRDMDKLAQAGFDARAAVSRIRTQIQVFDEACARDRQQQRLFSGTNPTASSKPVLFVICGQSNAVGAGEYGPYDHAEDCGQFWSYRTGINTLRPIVDPIGKHGGVGSQWPEFARRFYALTGRKVILLNIASGGAAIVDNGAANCWADAQTATLRPWAEGIWAAFAAAVPSTDYDFGAILWSQGESESAMFAAGILSDSVYVDALSDVLEWLRTLVGVSDAPVFNCMIGFNVSALTNSVLKAGYEHMHEIQQSFFNSQNGLYNICSMPRRFASAWDEFMQGVVHYGPIGYHIVGDAFARAAAHYISL